MKHKIVNCEKTIVLRHMVFTPPLSQTVTLSQTLYPLGRDILYGRSHRPIPTVLYRLYLLKHNIDYVVLGVSLIIDSGFGL